MKTQNLVITFNKANLSNSKMIPVICNNLDKLVSLISLKEFFLKVSKSNQHKESDMEPLVWKVTELLLLICLCLLIWEQNAQILKNFI